MKIEKILKISFLVIYGLSLTQSVSAQIITGACATDPTKCQLCDVFQTIWNLVNLIMTAAPILATIMIVVGGIMIMVSSGNPSLRQQGLNVLKNTLIGFILIISATLIIQTLISWVANGSLVNWPNVICS